MSARRDLFGLPDGWENYLRRNQQRRKAAKREDYGPGRPRKYEQRPPLVDHQFELDVFCVRQQARIRLNLETIERRLRLGPELEWQEIEHGQVMFEKRA
jgi:hypothetical protein